MCTGPLHWITKKMNVSADVQRISYPNGNTYEGEIVNGMAHGHGKKTFSDGEVMKDNSKTRKRQASLGRWKRLCW